MAIDIEGFNQLEDFKPELESENKKLRKSQQLKTAWGEWLDHPWRHEPPNKIRKLNPERRNLRFDNLNEPFENSERHHITKELIVHIPKEMHRSVYHNIFTGLGMVKINNLAMKWLESEQETKCRPRL